MQYDSTRIEELARERLGMCGGETGLSDGAERRKERLPPSRHHEIWKCGHYRAFERGKIHAPESSAERKIAIVSDKPQTTRTRILGVAHVDGAQIVFLIRRGFMSRGTC